MHHYLRNEKPVNFESGLRKRVSFVDFAVSDGNDENFYRLVGSQELRTIDQNGRTTNMPSVAGSDRNLLRGSRLKLACDLEPDDLAFIRATVLRQRKAQDHKRLKENLSVSTPALNLVSPHHTWRLDDELSICSVSSSASSRPKQANGSLSPVSAPRTQKGPQYEWMEERRRRPSSRTPSPTRSPVGTRIFGYRPNIESTSRLRHSPINHSRRSESPQNPPTRRSESAQNFPVRRSESAQNVSARRSESAQNVSARRSESAQNFPAAMTMEPLQRPKRKDAINARSWRRGQEIIKREIGSKKSRPSKDQNDDPEKVSTSATPPLEEDRSAASDKVEEEEEAKKEDKPLRSVRSRRRRVSSTPASATATSSSPPRHRHYDPNAVRTYLRRQRESRRRIREEQLAEEEARKARRQEQLADLHRRQRNSAAASPQSTPAQPPESAKDADAEMEDTQDQSGSRTPTNVESEEEQDQQDGMGYQEEEETGLQDRILALEGSANSLQLRVQRLAESLQDSGPPPSYFDRVSPIPRTRGGSLDAVSFSPLLFLSPLMLSRSMEGGLHYPVVESSFETQGELQLPHPQPTEVAEKPERSTEKLRSKSFEGNEPPRKHRERRSKSRVDVSASLESADTEDDVASSLSSRLSAENGVVEAQSSSTVEKEEEATRVMQKDLRLRERQLAERRRVAEEMLRWRSRLDAEEAEVQALERKALQLCKVNTKEEQEEKGAVDVTDGAPCPVNGSAIQLMEEEVDRAVAPPVPPPRHRRQIGRVEPENVEKRTEGEEEPQVQPQPAPALTNRLKQRLAGGGGGGLTALTLTNKPQAPVSSAPSSASPQSTPSSVSERPLQRVPKQDAVGSEEEDSQSVSISETDVSEIEGRVRALSEELKRRRRMADRLKREQKRKHRERLKQKEDVLQRHIEMYDKYISELQCDLNAATSALHSSNTPGAPSSCNSSESIDSPPVRPKIKSPRAATQQQILPLSIPATTSSSSAADEDEEEEEEKSDETVKNEEEDEEEEDKESERKEEDDEEEEMKDTPKEDVEQAKEPIDEEKDSLTPQVDEDAAPTIRSELTDIPRDEDGSPAHVPQRRDSVATDAEVESTVWSAASDSEPEEKEETEDERKASAMAEDIISRLLSETLDLVAGPTLEERIDVAVADWLSSALSQTIDRALPLHQRQCRNPVTAQRSEAAPWAVPGAVPVLSPPAHFAGSSVSGGAVVVPFRLVNHWPDAVSDLVRRYVDDVWPSILAGSLARVEMEDEEDDEALSGAERRARAAYRSLVFDLTHDCVTQVMETEGKSTAINLLPGPSRYRVWGGTKPPTTKDDLVRIVDEAVAVVFGFRPCLVQESRLSRWTASRKREHVEELLVYELRREEPSWTDYSWDERRVKMQTADSLLDSLISETTQICMRLHRPLCDTSKHF